MDVKPLMFQSKDGLRRNKSIVERSSKDGASVGVVFAPARIRVGPARRARREPARRAWWELAWGRAFSFRLFW